MLNLSCTSSKSATNIENIRASSLVKRECWKLLFPAARRSSTAPGGCRPALERQVAGSCSPQRAAQRARLISGLCAGSRGTSDAYFEHSCRLWGGKGEERSRISARNPFFLQTYQISEILISILFLSRRCFTGSQLEDDVRMSC